MSLPAVKIAHPHVELTPDGIPVIHGSRVPVRRLWSWYRREVSIETLIKRYPTLGANKVLDALSFAFDNVELVEADLAREYALWNVPTTEDYRQGKLFK